LIYGLIQRRFIYSMIGPTGEGKTSIALLIALLVDRGQSLNGRDIEKGIMVQRLIKALASHKFIKKYGTKWVLTKDGKQKLEDNELPF
jgi:hypothetical protein